MNVPFHKKELSDREYIGRLQLLDVRSPEDSIIPNISLDDFYKLLVNYGWCYDTSVYKATGGRYDGHGDGQCAVTAAFVYDVFGGKIIKPRSWHYANEINGIRLDMTTPGWDDYRDAKLKYIPRWMTCKGKDASARLELLKKRVFDAIKRQGLE